MLSLKFNGNQLSNKTNCQCHQAFQIQPRILQITNYLSIVDFSFVLV